ncbi:MAG: hypothetical protein ACLPV8_02450 [Steroidobacteraceae bacterium]
MPTASVRSQAVSYDDAIEDTTNKFLVLNILRAKDKAPLHFDEIPSIHESIQATGSLGFTIPYGPRPTTSPGRNVLTTGASVQVSPSFEVDHLDTKDFITGLASPIDPKFVKYWLDRGLDPRLVLLLFFSAADIVVLDEKNHVSQTIRIRNSPREATASLKSQTAPSTDLAPELRCDMQSDFQHYLKLIDSLRSFSAHSSTERRILTDHLTVDPKNGFKDLSEIASLDQSKYQWSRHADGTYTIYAISSQPKTALCFANSPVQVGTESPNKQDACVQSVVDIATDDAITPMIEPPPLASPMAGRREQPSTYCAQFNGFLASIDPVRSTNNTPTNTRTELRLEIRSVGEIIQFLGDLLEYQDELRVFVRANPTVKLKLNNPLTFGYCADGDSAGLQAGCGDVFFNLRHDYCNARFTLTYRGKRYSVPNYNPPDQSMLNSLFCSPAELDVMDTFGPRDHTLEVLAVVHQLVDLQKSAQDIRETPYVQVLP